MYQIKNDSEIYIYDEITTGQTARGVMKALRDMEGAITLRINSSGGDVFEAIALYNVLKSHEVRVYVDGICASAASIIAMSGHVVMPVNAMMMIHNPVSTITGDSGELAALSDILEKISGNIAGIYATKTGLPVGKIREMMEAETWLDGREAKSLGFADELGGEVVNKKTLTYTDGVNDERARMRELDSISGYGHDEIISRAKYETFQSADEIALELLRMERRSRDSGRIPEVISRLSKVDDEGREVAEIMNKIRGWR